MHCSYLLYFLPMCCFTIISMNIVTIVRLATHVCSFTWKDSYVKDVVIVL